MTAVGVDTFNASINGDCAHTMPSIAGPGRIPHVGTYNVQATYSEGSGPHAQASPISKCLDSHGLNPDCQQGGTLIALPIPIDMRQASRGATMTNNRSDDASSGGAPGTGIGEAGDPAHTLGTTHTPAIAFAQNQRDEIRMMDVAGALAADPGMKQQTYLAMPTMAVRRLTPLEAERLMGFPDGYTAIPFKGKPAADGPRYRALGNSMVVPELAWIGRRIMEVDAIPAEGTAA